MYPFTKNYLTDQYQQQALAHRHRLFTTKSVLPHTDLLHLLRKQRRLHTRSNQFRQQEIQRKTEQQNNGIQRRLMSQMQNHSAYSRYNSKKTSRRSMRSSKDNENALSTNHQIIEQNQAFSSRLSAVVPTIRLAQLNKDYRKTRKYRRLASRRDKIEKSSRSLVQPEHSHTIFMVDLKPMGHNYFDLCVQIKDLRFPFPKTEQIAYRLVFKIQAQTGYQRKFINPPKLHFERQLVKGQTIREIHRSTTKPDLIDKNHISIPSEIISLNELCSSVFIFRGGFAKVMEYAEVDIFMVVVAVHPDWEEDIGYFSCHSMDGEMAVYGKRGKQIGKMVGKLELEIGTKKGGVVNDEGPFEVVNKGGLFPVGEQRQQ